MPEPTKDRVALVTGANKGIGLEVARQLGVLGWRVLVGARDAQRGSFAASLLNAQGIQARFEEIDIEDDASIQAAARRIEAAFGRLDALVNNAGVLCDLNFPRPTQASEELPILPSGTPIDILRRTYATNVFGVAAVINAMLPLLKRADAARIVNVSSKFASLSFAQQIFRGESQERYFNLLAYNTSKAALNALTLQYAIELRHTRIKVNSVDPGHCATDINGRTGDRHPAEAAKIVVGAATLPDDGPSGSFIAENGHRAW